MSTEWTDEDEKALAEMKAADEAPVEEAPAEDEAASQEAVEPAEAEEKPEPEAKTEDAAKPPEGYVPHQAMHAERLRRQEAERRLKEIEERLKADEKPKEEEQIPDPVVDPEKWAAYQRETTGRSQQEIQRLRQEIEQERYQRQVFNAVTMGEQRVKAEKPDYDTAISHLMEARKRELAYFTDDQDAINNQIRQDLWGVSTAAIEKGLNPAEVLYNIAHQRGYQPPEADTGTPDAASRVTAAAKAQEATASLSQASGGPQSGRLTADQLAAMPEKDFAKLSDDDIRKAMGG